MVELPPTPTKMREKRKKPEPHNIFVTIRGLCLRRTVDYASRADGRFCNLLHHRSEASALKTVGIANKQRLILSLKLFFHLARREERLLSSMIIVLENN